MGEKIRSDYQQKLFPLWWQEIKLWFGWTDWLNAVFRTGIQVGSIWLLYFLSGKAEAFLDSAFVLVCQWLLGFFLLYFVLAITYTRASKKLYDGQKQREQEKNKIIKRLENRQRNPFKITERPPHPDNRPLTEARSASITVKNASRTRVSGCFLTLDSVKDGRGKEKMTRQRKLSWSSGETQDEADNKRVNKEIDLIPGVEIIADVAETAQNEIITTVWRGGQRLAIGKYDIHITAHGTVNGNDVSQSVVLVMDYKGDNDVELRKKGDRKNGDRKETA